MVENEKISIIVPVYQVQDYFLRCVTSVVEQSYRNTEIIIIDDGSFDLCPSICDEVALSDSRIYVIHKKNGGLSNARNYGLKVAIGSYVSFVDSDDWLHCRFIESLHKAIKQNNVDIAACNVYETDEQTVSDNGNDVSFIMKIFESSEAIQTIQYGKTIQAVAWNKLYKNSLLTAEFFEENRLHEDEFFTYRIIDKARKIVFIDAPLYYYFQRKDSIMRTLSVRHLDSLDAYLERLRLLEEKYPELVLRDKIIICRSCYQFYKGLNSFSSEERKKAIDKIKDIRTNIVMTKNEKKESSLRDLLYYYGTKPWLIRIFTALSQMKGGC